jgi:DNA-binding transcriptional LysR family regulator
MRLRHIEIFQAVLQAGTLTGAAALLNISQPAATKLLQQAERQLGFGLFARVRGRLQLTEQALILRDKVEKISDEMRDLQRLAANLRSSGSRILRIVSTPTLANAMIPRAVTCLRKPFRDVHVELFTQHSREMVNSILLRESDLGLTLQEMSQPLVNCLTVCQGELMVIAPMGWWSNKELGQPIAIHELADTNLVGIATRDSLGRQLQAHLEYLSPPPKISTWVQTYQLARSLVRNGHGLALVDPFTAFGDGDGFVQIRPLAPQMVISLHAIYRADTGLDAIQKAFLESVRHISDEMLSSLAPRTVQAAVQEH